ncbi:hypothetical protein [Arcanobacterium phocae]|uniref:hypothetical protein n=1 Tax=Arcanobacterium phocae TaxID=131112 RepID=UPI001C0F2246|nr:hypothetical protein [Arcanobacterium phocae]
MNSARRYLILTTFQHPGPVAGVLKLRGISATVVPTDSGAVIVRDIPVKSFDDWDISELLGGADDTAKIDETADISDQPGEVAAIVSQLSEYGVILLTADLGDDVGTEVGTSGLVSAVRYLSGQRDEEIPGGLILNVLDPLIESLLLGQKDPADVPGAISKMTSEELEQIFREINGDEESDRA